MRLNVGSVLLLLLVGLVTCVTAPRQVKGTSVEVKTGRYVANSPRGVCPSQCHIEYAVMVCHHADGLNLVRLAQCVNTISALSVVELRSTADVCSCSLLEYIRLTTDARVLTFTPTPCGAEILANCDSLLPDRARGMDRRGLVAGLVMEQDEAGWRKATKRHLSWLWNKVNTLFPTAAKTRYRTLIINTVKSVYWTKGELKPGNTDRIVPFALYKSGHMGPLYGGGRMGWYPVHDFTTAAESASGKKWLPMKEFNPVEPAPVVEESKTEEETVEETEKEEKETAEGKDEEEEEPSVSTKKEESVKITEEKAPDGVVHVKVEKESDKTEVLEEESPAINYTVEERPSSKKMTIILAIICFLVALCIIGIIVQMCRKGPPFDVQESHRGDKSGSDVHIGDKSKSDHKDLDKPTSQQSIKEKYKPEEINRRLSLPYSKWTKDDFELARELENDKLRGAASAPAVGGVHQKVPPEKQAQYEKLKGEKTSDTGRDQDQVWTQVNAFDIVDEVKKEEDKGKDVKFGTQKKPMFDDDNVTADEARQRRASIANRRGTMYVKAPPPDESEDETTTAADATSVASEPATATDTAAETTSSEDAEAKEKEEAKKRSLEKKKKKKKEKEAEPPTDEEKVTKKDSKHKKEGEGGEKRDSKKKKDHKEARRESSERRRSKEKKKKEGEDKVEGKEKKDGKKKKKKEEGEHKGEGGKRKDSKKDSKKKKKEGEGGSDGEGKKDSKKDSKKKKKEGEGGSDGEGKKDSKKDSKKKKKEGEKGGEGEGKRDSKKDSKKKKKEGKSDSEGEEKKEGKSDSKKKKKKKEGDTESEGEEKKDHKKKKEKGKGDSSDEDKKKDGAETSDQTDSEKSGAKGGSAKKKKKEKEGEKGEEGKGKGDKEKGSKKKKEKKAGDEGAKKEKGAGKAEEKEGASDSEPKAKKKKKGGEKSEGEGKESGSEGEAKKKKSKKTKPGEEGKGSGGEGEAKKKKSKKEKSGEGGKDSGGEGEAKKKKSKKEKSGEGGKDSGGEGEAKKKKSKTEKSGEGGKDSGGEGEAKKKKSKKEKSGEGGKDSGGEGKKKKKKAEGGQETKGGGSPKRKTKDPAAKGEKSKKHRSERGPSPGRRERRRTGGGGGGKGHSKHRSKSGGRRARSREKDWSQSASSRNNSSSSRVPSQEPSLSHTPAQPDSGDEFSKKLFSVLSQWSEEGFPPHRKSRSPKRSSKKRKGRKGASDVGDTIEEESDSSVASSMSSRSSKHSVRVDSLAPHQNDFVKCSPSWSQKVLLAKLGEKSPKPNASGYQGLSDTSLAVHQQEVDSRESTQPPHARLGLQADSGGGEKVESTQLRTSPKLNSVTLHGDDGRSETKPARSGKDPGKSDDSKRWLKVHNKKTMMPDSTFVTPVCANLHASSKTSDFADVLSQTIESNYHKARERFEKTHPTSKAQQTEVKCKASSPSRHSKCNFGKQTSPTDIDIAVPKLSISYTKTDDGQGFIRRADLPEAPDIKKRTTDQRKASASRQLSKTFRDIDTEPSARGREKSLHERPETKVRSHKSKNEAEVSPRQDDEEDRLPPSAGERSPKPAPRVKVSKELVVDVKPSERHTERPIREPKPRRSLEKTNRQDPETIIEVHNEQPQTPKAHDYIRLASPSGFQKKDDKRQDLHSVHFALDDDDDDIDLDRIIQTLTTASPLALPSTSDIEHFVQDLERTSPKLFTEFCSKFQRLEQDMAESPNWLSALNSANNSSQRTSSSLTWPSPSSASDIQQSTLQLNMESLSVSPTEQKQPSEILSCTGSLISVASSAPQSGVSKASASNTSASSSNLNPDPSVSISCSSLPCEIESNSTISSTEVSALSSRQHVGSSQHKSVSSESQPSFSSIGTENESLAQSQSSQSTIDRESTES